MKQSYVKANLKDVQYITPELLLYWDVPFPLLSFGRYAP